MTPTGITEKNKSTSDSVFLVLLALYIPSLPEPLYIVNNSDDVYWAGLIWRHIPFTIDELPAESTTDDLQAKFRISNVNRMVEQYLREYDEWTKENTSPGILVDLFVVNSLNLSSNTPELNINMRVISYDTTPQWVSFYLGSRNLNASKFPKHIYQVDICRHRFKDSRCKYTGFETYCEKTRSACATYDNLLNYGGFALIENKIREV